MEVLKGEKYRWHLPEAEPEMMTKIASRYNLSVPVIQTLISRNLTSPQEIEEFLFSDASRDVSSPDKLYGASKAVDRILQAIEKGEKILICGDYDVDGITSSALILSCLLPLGAKINFFLPNRVRDGYGLAAKTVERAAANDYKVIITVDNGITAFDAAKTAKRLGIDLIITDHHRPHKTLPQAFAIINPHQKKCSYPFKYFAGVGVSFKLMSLLYEKLSKQLPAKVYELLLLGTVADVVPLRGENRYWVRHGLHHIKEHESMALGVLKQNSRVRKPQLSSQDIGFFITPQLNALGRLDDPRDGVTFLMSNNRQEIERIGSVLNTLNQARRVVERTILDDINAELEKKDVTAEPLIVASNTRWPMGVIGLAASRVVSAHNRPTFLFHITSDGIAKGSCRSIRGFNIFNALQEVQDLLISFGGHAAAAGLSMPAQKLPLFEERMREVVTKTVKPEDFLPTLQLDAEVDLESVNPKLVADLEYLEPFGCENNVPLFCLRNVSLMGDVQLLKDAHVKCFVFSHGKMKPVIFFNRPELYARIKSAGHASCDLAVHVIENHWNNETKVELQGIDICIGA